MIALCRNTFYKAVLLSIVVALTSITSFGQNIVKPQVLGKTDWQNYFTQHFGLKHAENIKTTIVTTDIPYPKTWKYLGDKDKEKAGKYLLYPVSPSADFMIMPSNNSVGSYLFYFNNNQPDKDIIEMNFLADSIICKQLTADIYMFQFNDDGFKIAGDSSGFKRYVFVSKTGRFAAKSIVAHTCTVALNSVDTTGNFIYLDVTYPKRTVLRKTLRFDYKNFLLLTELNDIEDLNGSIVIDAVHYSYIKKLEEGTN